MTLLVIRIAGSGESAPWVLLSADGDVLGHGTGAPPSDAARTILIVPGEDVTAHSVHLPGVGDAPLRAAARFAVEDDLAVDADRVHLAIGPGGAAEPRLVAAAARSAMDSWLAAFPAPDVVAPEWACVPALADECGVWIEGDVAHANFGGWGFSADRDLAALLLPGALDRFDVRRLTVWGNPSSIEPAAGWGGREVIARPDPVGEDALTLLARGAADARVNLLQGAYAPRRALALDMALWRRAAILLCALFLCWLGLSLAETTALNRQAAALRTDAEAVFAETFPDEARIVNPRLQMQTRLAGLRGREGGAFLDLAATLASAIAAEKGVEISALRYDRGSGALDAEILMPDYDTLQALRAGVQAQGAAMEEGASRQAAGRVAANVTVRLP